MRKKLCCIMSVVLALSICMPGGAMQALAADGGGQVSTSATVSQESAASGQAADESQSSSAVAQEQGEQEPASDPGKASQAVPGPADVPTAAGESQANGTRGSPTDEPAADVPAPAAAKAPLRAPTQGLTNVTIDGMTFTPVWDGNNQTGNYALSKYAGEGTTLDIPAEIEGSDGASHPVTKVYQDLQGYEKIEHLTIPDSVVEIDNSAFAHCTNLKDVSIGSGVTNLTWTFDDCTALASVTFAPNSSLKEIYGGFSGCTNLTQLTLPDGLEEVHLAETYLEEVTLPSSVKKIYDYGFSNCPNLEKVNIPEGVTELGNSTFLNCPNLTTITGGKNVTSIGDSCFGGYDYGAGEWVQDDKLASLGDINLGKLESIGEYAFFGVANLPDYDLSLGSVTSLGTYAFYNNNWISKLTLGDGLESVPDPAFAYCYNIGDITIPNGVKTIGDEAFAGVDAATIAIGSSNQSQLESIGANAFADAADGSSITINTAESDVNLKANSFGALDNVTWTVPSVDETGKVLYLDGASGSDANDGTAKDKAVKTFARAKELAAANQDILYINVIGTADVSGDVSLEGTNATLRRDQDFAGYLLQVKGNTATLKDITVDGNARKANATNSLVYVKDATLNIKDGAVLQNNRLTSLGWQSGWGGAVYVDGSKTGSTVNMSGGAIKNNTANIGGGICLDYGNTFNMSGGTISNNHAVTGTTSGDGGYASGGGVALAEKYGATGKPMTFNLSGGTIEGNSSQDMGGGISLGSGVSTYSQPILNMTGGAVQNNTSGSCGGGIFVQYGYDEKGSNHASYGIANISGGSILNNQMLGDGHGNKAFGGGGIYVNGGPSEWEGTYYHKAELNLTNALITNNAANQEGGGYAACPVTETHIYVKDGAALYGNDGSGARDLYILASTEYGNHSGDPVYTVANSMLGGTPYNWKYDDGTEVPLNKLEGTLHAMSSEHLSLHTDVTSDEAAQNLAKVTISGNSSTTRGGGIGSNGTVNIGKSDVTEVAVHKTWEDGGNADRPRSVAVELYRTVEGAAGEPVYVGYETIRPDDNDAWELTFKNLPKTDANDNEYVYSVKERAIDGYAATVTGSQEGGFEIKNALNTSVTVTKAWDDANDQDGIRPNSVQVQLYANGEPSGDPVTLDEGSSWTHTWTNLFQKEGGQDVAYTVQEVGAPSGYTVSVSGDATSGFTVTNSRTPETTSVPVTKTWVGPVGSAVTIHLLADGTDTGKTVTLDEAGSWTGSFYDLAKYRDHGTEISYTVSEDEVEGYTSEITGDAASGFTVTNTKDDTPGNPGTPSHGKSGGTSFLPKTGDDAAAPIALLAAALAAAAGLLARRRMTAEPDGRTAGRARHSKR